MPAEDAKILRGHYFFAAMIPKTGLKSPYDEGMQGHACLFSSDWRTIMQVTKIINGQGMRNHDVVGFTEEALQREYDYYMTQKLLKKLLGAGLISEGEFNKITEKNRQTFSSYLAEIMPEMT